MHFDRTRTGEASDDELPPLPESFRARPSVSAPR